MKQRTILWLVVGFIAYQHFVKKGGGGGGGGGSGKSTGPKSDADLAADFLKKSFAPT